MLQHYIYSVKIMNLHLKNGKHTNHSIKWSKKYTEDAMSISISTVICRLIFGKSRKREMLFLLSMSIMEILQCKSIYGGEQGMEWVLDAISFHCHKLLPFAFSSIILLTALFILPSFQNVGICFSIPGSLAQAGLQAHGCLPWRRCNNHTPHLEALGTLSEVLEESSIVSRSRGSFTLTELCALGLPMANSINPGRWELHNLISLSWGKTGLHLRYKPSYPYSPFVSLNYINPVIHLSQEYFSVITHYAYITFLVCL